MTRTVGIMLCLSCHDGNLAVNGMMTGHTFETIPNAIGGHAPTWLGKRRQWQGRLQKRSPSGTVSHDRLRRILQLGLHDCGGKLVAPAGKPLREFQLDYGFTVEHRSFDGVNPAVNCTTCHDQHSMTAYAGTIGNVKGVVSDDVLRPRLLQPQQPNQQLRGAVLPSVAMVANRTKCTTRTSRRPKPVVHEMGGGSFSPHFTSEQRSVVRNKRKEVKWAEGNMKKALIAMMLVVLAGMGSSGEGADGGFS